jgi:hypothetical protein
MAGKSRGRLAQRDRVERPEGAARYIPLPEREKLDQGPTRPGNRPFPRMPIAAIFDPVFPRSAWNEVPFSSEPLPERLQSLVISRAFGRVNFQADAI